MTLKRWLPLKLIIATGIALLSEQGFARDCELQKKAELKLGYTASLLTVEAKINGALVTLGLDTGAQTTVTPETAKTLQLAHDWRRTRVIGTTAVKIVSHVLLRDFEFAGSHFRSKSVTQILLPQQKPTE